MQRKGNGCKKQQAVSLMGTPEWHWSPGYLRYCHCSKCTDPDSQLPEQEGALESLNLRDCLSQPRAEMQRSKIYTKPKVGKGPAELFFSFPAQSTQQPNNKG